MRSRVLQHFIPAEPGRRECGASTGSAPSASSARCCARRELVKELQPGLQPAVASPGSPVRLRLRLKRLRLAAREEIGGETLPYVHGLFRSRRAALQALRGSRTNRLVPADAGLRFRSAWRVLALPARAMRAACARAGRTCTSTTPAWPTRLARMKAAEWPHAGPLGIVERDPGRDATEVHVVDRWCYLGAARSDAEVAELLEGERAPRFDYDHYRILARHLGRHGVRTVPLAAPMHCELIVPGLFAGDADARRGAGAAARARPRGSAAASAPRRPGCRTRSSSARRRFRPARSRRPAAAADPGDSAGCAPTPCICG